MSFYTFVAILKLTICTSNFISNLECLTISSDEETDEFDHVMSSSIPDHNEVSVSIMNKEPLIEKSEVLGGRTDTAGLFYFYILCTNLLKCYCNLTLLYE